jgi:peptidoglycan-associated lipoprotein
MKKHALWVFAVLCGGALFVGGCATHDAYTTGESSMPSASSQSGQYRENSDKMNDGTAKINEENMVTGAPRTPQTSTVKTETPSSKGVKLNGALEKIYFDFDATTLSEQARTSLANNAERLRKNSTVTVRIEGHCDERGSDEYNLALGEKRAKTAMHYLVTMGIPAKRLSVLSYGKEKPADSGHDEAAWSKNRRDEFVVMSK